jgi:hypothetical protein
MGTSNFYNVNASKIFVVLEPHEVSILDENFNETGELETIGCGESDVEYLIDSITNDMKELGDDLYYHFRDKKSLKDLRDYPSSYLGSLTKERVFYDINVLVYIHAFLRSGYYEGANLDWECDILIDNGKQVFFDNQYYDINDLYFILKDKNTNEKLIESIDNWIKETKTSLIEKIESVFEKNSEQYTVFARFSNGETLYQQIEK